MAIAKCPIAKAVSEEVLRRSDRGIEKYGVTADRDDLTISEWLQHAKEESLDKAIYLEKLKNELSAEKIKQNTAAWLVAHGVIGDGHKQFDGDDVYRLVLTMIDDLFGDEVKK